MSAIYLNRVFKMQSLFYTKGYLMKFLKGRTFQTTCAPESSILG